MLAEGGIVIMVVYDLGNITDWLTSVGTISAVIVALYLANRDRKPRAKVFTKFSYAVGPFGIASEPVSISCGIVNNGTVPIYLSECSIRVKRNYKMSFFDGSHKVDKLLVPGEYYEHTLNYDQIKKGFTNEKIFKVRTYIYFSDANGRRYKSRLRFDIK